MRQMKQISFNILYRGILDLKTVVVQPFVSPTIKPCLQRIGILPCLDKVTPKVNHSTCGQRKYISWLTYNFCTTIWDASPSKQKIRMKMTSFVPTTISLVPVSQSAALSHFGATPSAMARYGIKSLVKNSLGQGFLICAFKYSVTTFKFSSLISDRKSVV